MNALGIGLAVVIVLTLGFVPADAKPGDPLAVRGTMVWPSVLAAEPFILVQSDDGKVFYVDVTATQRRGSAMLRAGQRVSLTGVEGGRPYETAAVILGSEDSALSALPPGASGEAAASPRTESVPTAPPQPPAPPQAAAPSETPYQRIHGTVKSLSGHTLVVKADNGQDVSVDVSRFDGVLRREMRQGQEITVFGRPQNGSMAAVGVIRTDR